MMSTQAVNVSNALHNKQGTNGRVDTYIKENPLNFSHREGLPAVSGGILFMAYVRKWLHERWHVLDIRDVRSVDC